MNIYSKIIKILAILALFAPLIISKSTLFPFIFGKAIAFQVLVELMIIVYLAGLVKFPEWRPKFSLLMAPLLAFFVVLILSTVFGADPYASFWSKHERMEGLFTLSHYFAFFFILTAVFRKKEEWLSFLRWSVIAALLVSFYGLAQILKMPGFIQGYGLSGTLGNSSFLATYLVFNSFFALFLFLSSFVIARKPPKAADEAISLMKQSPVSWFYLGCFLLFNFILLLTGTRAALYGQFLGLFAFFGLYGFFLASLRLKKIIAACLVLAVVFVSLIFVFRDSAFVKGNRVLARVTDTSLQSATLQQRFAGWRAGIEGFKARPLLGWGQENYSIVFYKFLDPYFYGPAETFDRPHNKYIDVLVSNGALGLLAYLGIFAVLFFWIWRNRSRLSSSVSVIATPSEARGKQSHYSSPNNFVPLWFFGLALAYLVQNTLLFDMPTSYPFFFLALGLANFIFASSSVIASSSSVIATPSEARGKQSHSFSSSFSQKIILVLTFVSIPFIVYLLFWGNYKPYYQSSELLIKALTGIPNDLSDSFDRSRHLFKSPSFVKVEGRNVLANGLIEKSGSVKPPLAENPLLRDYALFIAGELEKGIKESPLNIRYHLNLVNLYNFLGAVDPLYFQKSEEAARRASALFPRDISILFQVFKGRMQQNDFDGAKEVIGEVLEKAPNSHLGHWYLALIHYNQNRFDLAEKEVMTAISLGYPYMGRTSNIIFIANIQLRLKNYSGAISYLEEALKLSPKDPQLIADIAATYYQMGDKAKAREWALKIIDINPDLKPKVDEFLEQIGD